MNILIVDDDVVIRKLISSVLLGCPEVTQCYQADSLVSAYQLLEQGMKPDVIFLDVHLPDSNSGLEVCQELKTSSALNTAVIVVVSADMSRETENEAYSKGADMFLTKPFNPFSLRKVVKRVA